MRHTKTIERVAILSAVIIAMLGTWAVTRVASESRHIRENDEYWEFAHVFNEVFHTIKRDYVTEVESEELFRAALNGMLQALDDHSVFMGSDSFTQLEKETEGEFSGVGLHITIQDGLLTVIAPIPGGPAASLGVQPWDRIIEIDAESTQGIKINDAVRRLTGPRGTQVEVKIWRTGLREPITLKITRDVIRIQSVFHRMLDERVGYLRLDKFSERSSREMMSALDEMREAGMQALIFDMRFNPGGLLSEAIRISDIFLPRDQVIVSTRGRDGKMLEEYKSSSDAVTNVPVMILVNRGSASAAEIVTAALRDHKRATIFAPKGQKTFGKGSVQTIMPLQNSFERDENGNYMFGALKLTTALYYTPSGETIDKIGITPDVEVEIPEGHDRQLLMRGLLGGPDMRGPRLTNGKGTPEAGAESGTNGETPADSTESNEEAVEAPAAPEAEGVQEAAGAEAGEIPFYQIPTLSRTEEAPLLDDPASLIPDEEFRDILLDEAHRRMKLQLDGLPEEPSVNNAATTATTEAAVVAE